MKNLLKFFVGLCLALTATFVLYSCLQDNELKQAADSIELFKIDKSDINESINSAIIDNGVLTKSLRMNGFMAQKEELLESYIHTTSKGKTFLITKSYTEAGIFLTMSHPVTIEDSGKVIVKDVTISTGCSSTGCSDCQPKLAPSGAVASCDCADVGENCTHTVCRTKDGRKDCCTSSGACEECTLYLNGDDFSRCDCDEAVGKCGHSVVIGTKPVGGN